MLSLLHWCHYDIFSSIHSRFNNFKYSQCNIFESKGYVSYVSGLLSRLLVRCCCVLVVQLLSHVRLFGTPWTAAHQAPLSSTMSQSVLRFLSIELVMLSNHLIFCCSLPLLKAFNLSQHQGLFQ